ncbi:hypothetical protein AAVH_37487, partial [Aphelenchoides avenae]
MANVPSHMRDSVSNVDGRLDYFQQTQPGFREFLVNKPDFTNVYIFYVDEDELQFIGRLPYQRTTGWQLLFW